METVFKAPSGHPAVAGPDGPAAKVTNRTLERRTNRALFWGLAVTVLGVTLLANAQDYELVSWLGILVFLAGAALAIYGAFSPGAAKALPSGQPSQPKALNRSKAELYLPPEDFSGPVPSVTERTTELLEVENTRTLKVKERRDAEG